MALAIMEPSIPLLGPVRERFRSLGLREQAAGTSFFYVLPAGDGRPLLILQPFGYGAQIYLYPEALDRPAGAAQWFYALLEADGFGMGSKAGPSISLALERPDSMATFWRAFERLLEGEGGLGDGAS